jgi:hypothetical protein
MLITTSEQKQFFETPAKKIIGTPQTERVQKAPHLLRTDPKLEQMSKLMTSLGIDDSCDIVEKELVQNDALWMKEMMTVRKYAPRFQTR